VSNAADICRISKTLQHVLEKYYGVKFNLRKQKTFEAIQHE